MSLMPKAIHRDIKPADLFVTSHPRPHCRQARRRKGAIVIAVRVLGSTRRRMSQDFRLWKRLGGSVTRLQDNVYIVGLGSFLQFLSWPDFLLGLDAQSNGTGTFSNVYASADDCGLSQRNYRAWERSAFAQDGIRVRQSLTLSLGLRHERFKRTWISQFPRRKCFPWLQEQATLEFRAEFFKAFDHPQFANPDSNFSSPSFGVISSTSVSARVVQFALKFGS